MDLIHVVPWFKANHGTLSRKGLENLNNSVQSWSVSLFLNGRLGQRLFKDLFALSPQYLVLSCLEILLVGCQ